MRLIDADALKETFIVNTDRKGYLVADPEVIIDNAPTVSERPHGEWIFGSTLGHAWMKCSNCCVSQSGQTLCWSYCPNCGADMRKGGKEQ